MDATNVTAGKPVLTGAVYRAPLGTTLPTTVSEDLSSAFKELGYISEEDVIGMTRAQIADGSIVENAIVNLKKLQIGDYVCYNVEASVSDNEQAPLLLGNGALKDVESFNIDDKRKVISLYLK